MRIKKILKALLLCFCIISITCCNNKDDDLGFRGFMSTATIVGDSINGYYCYLDGGGLAISHDQRLAGIERGYFAFHYTEEDWRSADNAMYINNASVFPNSVYNVIRPISKEEADNKHITDKDSCMVPKHLSLDHGHRGYFDLHTALSVGNLIDGKKVFAKMNIVYDPVKQSSDTLLLQLSYNLNIPDKWSNIGFDYGSVSCDISSLATKKLWSDSVTIVVKAGDEKIHTTKINKNDFLKPDIKLDKF
ncbi:MAG: hypothetical protein RRY36_09205 [Bacteroidaceae bacterium]